MSITQLAIALEDIKTRLPKGVRLHEFTPGNPMAAVPDKGGSHTYFDAFMIALETYPPFVYEDGYDKRNVNILEISNSSSVEAMKKLIMDKAQEVLAYRG